VSVAHIPLNKISNDGSTTSTYHPQNVNFPQGIAIGSNNHAFIANANGENVLEIDNTGTEAHSYPVSNNVTKLAFDGNGNLWLISSKNGIVSNLIFHP